MGHGLRGTRKLISCGHGIHEMTVGGLQHDIAGEIGTCLDQFVFQIVAEIGAGERRI